MSDSENVCVGCKRPMVDETIEGDSMLEDRPLHIDSTEMIVGARSGCPNCAVILDAITTFAGNEDATSLSSSYSIWPTGNDRTLSISGFIEVFRCSKDPQTIGHRRFAAWNLKELPVLSADEHFQETLRTVRQWKTSCMEHHEHCLPRVASPLPKRILEIGAAHICLRELPGITASYACLSHCWGPSGPGLQLRADTLERLRKGLSIYDLPLTFRHAVEVCRQLGIHYVWIDALCILQDSREDWIEAAATMGDIYENSHITIAATASRDSDGGLYPSNACVMRRLNKHPHLGVRKTFGYFPRSTHSITWSSMPLLHRAWVYQERRLSTRTVHFGKDQAFWECQTQFASENASDDETWRTAPEDVKYMSQAGWGDRLVNRTSRWQKMMSEYTSLQLTYESDRLPAIAALADRQWKLREADDVYIAGIWKNSILLDLLWTRQGDVLRPRPVRTAPSWSWASTQSSKILWGPCEFLEQVKVISLDYTAIGAANLGEVASASITLAVPVLNLTGGDTLTRADLNHLNQRQRFDDIFGSASIRNLFRENYLRQTYREFLPDYDLATANPAHISGRAIKLLVAKMHDVHAYENRSGICGIVVQQTSWDAAEYERIGSLIVIVEWRRPITEEEWDERCTNFGRTIEESIDSLILSFTMEEVKIV